MSTYSVVVAVHIIAVVARVRPPAHLSAADALRCAATTRRRCPASTRSSTGSTSALTGPWHGRCCSPPASTWPPTRHRWGEPFVGVGLAAIAIIARRRRRGGRPGHQAARRAGPGTPEYDARVPPLHGAEMLPRRVVVLVAIFFMAAKPRSRVGAHATSLAQLLTATAERARRPARPQARRHRRSTTPCLNEGATRIAGLLKEKGIEPGDRVGIMLPNVPYFARRLLRHPARGRRRRADERAAQGPRGRVLPRRLGRQGRVRLARASPRPRRPARRRRAPR